MDPEILKAIGPYGKKYTAVNPLPTPKINAFKQLIIKSGSTKKKQVTLPAETPKPAKAVTNFGAFHKKPNLKFLQGADSKRNDRQAQMDLHRKSKRSEAVMAKRKVGLKETSSYSNSTSQDSVNSKDIVVSVLSTNTKSNSTKIIEQDEMNNKVPQIVTNARREQLQKWKKEKEAVENNLKAVKRPPFKPGGQPVLANKNPGTILPTGINSSIGDRSNIRPNVPVKTTSIITSKPVTQQSSENGQGNERRVTRAMAKACTITKPCNDAGSKPTVLKPAIKGMKNLNLNGNTVTKSTDKPIQSTTGIADKQNIKSKTTTPQISSSVKKPHPLKSTQGSDNNCSTESVEPEKVFSAPVKETVVYKKLKPRGIDSVFIEHNANFSAACEKLGNLQKHWKVVVESPEIPEDIRDDIISALGKVKLLLDSKLPQFGELLYSYLCKEMNPGLILECDLQGWWDVASIQLELIQTEFSHLKKLQGSDWVGERDFQQSMSAKPNNHKLKLKPKLNEEGSLKTPQKQKVAKPSKGIQAFLAMKRKMQGEQNIITEQKKVPETEGMDDVILMKNQDNLTTNFEGGFFSISSPAKSTPARRLSRRTNERGNLSFAFNTPTTPSRRRSSNVSLYKMLSVRNSMGSICKIGVRPTIPPQTENTSSHLISEDHMEVSADGDVIVEVPNNSSSEM